MSGQEELARRRRNLQYRAGFHLFMHPARRDALRLVLYRDPIGFTIGGIGNGIVALDGGMTRNFEPEGQILAGLMLDDRTTIRWAENEGFYDGAFLAHFVYPECTPTGPAALSRSEFAIEMIFACNQDVGEERSEEHTSELQSLMRIS